MKYVLEFKRNTLLISMFDLMGLTTNIKHDAIKILKGTFIVSKGKKMDDLYILDGFIVIVHSFVAS